jgi:hypothetical protein
MATTNISSNLTLLVCSVITGCASPTATIAREAVNVREAAAVAEHHLSAAQDALRQISASANQVSMATAYVSDDESPLLSVMRYGSYIAGALAVGAVAYAIKTRT